MKSKMKLFDRILLALYALVGIVVALGVTYALINGMTLTVFGQVIMIDNSQVTILIASVLCLVVLLWSIRLLMLAFRHEPKMDKSSVAVQNSENGSVRISLSAMDTLVKQAVGDAEGIVEIKTRILNHEDSISVGIDMTLESDVHIPNVTMLMQRSIKNFIEEFSGIAVREVTVMVTKIIEVTPHPPLALEQGEAAQAAEQPEPPAPEPEADQAPEAPIDAEPEPEPEPAEEPETDWAVEPEPEPTEPEPEPDGAQPVKPEQEEFSEKDIW